MRTGSQTQVCQHADPYFGFPVGSYLPSPGGSGDSGNTVFAIDDAAAMLAFGVRNFEMHLCGDDGYPGDTLPDQPPDYPPDGSCWDSVRHLGLKREL